ncbi:RnfH family protein [Undibacterium oligocarboniphilum]|uniref:UPF0125 protein HV832_02660 n=1 Tax=Undibacterium oligocarboniphilum TaxID=666702 RepID=A0A850QD05_9BURK|nr:RnfH family protein [Undibacterium oligocarboniphilum]MBC3868756.1 RnfH family protein [Undibacterium oligocarboniphilum]NVO76737.1 RnfH family protein [Undibacterium oligocarboniphilum]
MPEIAVQVCYASVEGICMLNVRLPAGTTVYDAIQESGVVRTFPEIDISILKVGVFGKLKELSTVLHEGDRVEIYRPLLADPMEARRRRARKHRQEKI